MQKAHTQLQQSSETAISSLRREAEKLKDELASAKSELALRTSEAVRKEAEWKSTQASLEGKLSAALQQADKAKESAQAKLKEMASVQSRVDDLERQLRDSRLSTSRAEDAEIVAKQLREQQPYIESLKAKLGQLGNENTGLRQRLENTEVLKDRISSLERDLLKKGDDKHRIEDLERELALLRAEKAQWAAFLPPAGSGGDSTPAGLAKKAYRAQLDLAVQKEKAGEVTSRLAAAEAELAETSIKLSTAQSRLRELELTSGKLEARTARAEKSKTLLVKEIELLKARCESYELELAETDGGRAAVDSTTEAKRWEAQAEGYRKRTEELEKELAEARAASGAPAPKQDAPVSADVVQRFQAQIRELESRLAEAKTEEKMLRKQCTALDDQVGLLERALGRGEYDPNTTKVWQNASAGYATSTDVRSRQQVLELRENPYSQSQAIRQEHLDRLCSENAALLAGLGKVASVPSASLKRAEFELEQAKKEVGEYVKRLDRLKKVFSEQASVVRESVGKLLGWKLDADPTNSRITLRSFYSAHESHCFYFKSAPGTSEHLKFLGSGSPEFLESLDPEVAYYLTKGGSLPGLLAWVTLEGFQRTTGALSMLPPDDGEGDGRKRRRG